MIQFFVPTARIYNIPANVLTKVFVGLDCMVFVIQIVGALMQPDISGTRTYMAGIGMQECFIMVFMAFVVKFHNTMLKLERLGVLSSEKSNWRTTLFTVYASLGLITVRSSTWVLSTQSH
jgi:hypothetical protein